MTARAAPLRVGVVGVGHLGRFHVQKYTAQPDVSLVGVVDVDQPRAVELASQYQTQAFVDYRDLFGRIECVSIAVPTQLHHTIARDFWPRASMCW